MSEPFLQFENVKATRGGKTVLDVPSLSAPAGKLTVVFGDNGAGKTTLLLAAAGLLDLEGGTVKLFGKPFHAGRAPAAKHLRRNIAFVFQDPYLFRRSVRSNISYGLRIRGVAKAERCRRVDAVIERLGLSALADRPANDLSGGERKLVALGRTLVLDPKVLLLDEVTSSLDDEARDRVLQLIHSLVAEKGTSVLMATHLDGIAKRLDSQAIVLKAGRLVPDRGA